MTRLFLSTLTILVLALGASSQDLGDPIPRKPREGDGVRFVPPEEGERPKEPKPDEEKGEPDPAEAEEETLDGMIAALEGWPNETAQRAVVKLVARAEEARPRLLAVLRGDSRTARAAAAMVLGKVGKPEDATAILLAARDRKMSTRVDVLLESAERLDPEAARKTALALLGDRPRPSPRPAQERAERFLAERLRDEDRPALMAILRSRSAGARRTALDLLAHRYGPDAVRESALAALGDSAPDVALRAATLLAGDDEALSKLRELARSYDSRPAAYAALSIYIRAVTEGVQPFGDDEVSALLGGRGIRSMEPLSRGVAAIVLSFVSYEDRVPEADAILEEEILPALLDNVGGARFFKDQPSLRVVSLQQLERLTGLTLGRDVRAWRTWWAENRESFVVRRRLREVRPEDYGSLALTIALPGRPAVVVSTDPEHLAIGAIVVDQAVARGIVEILTREGFFGGKRWTASGTSRDAGVAIRVGRREHEAYLAAAEAGDSLSEIAERVEAVRARSVWQRYWDKDDYPRAGDFIRQRASWFGPDVPPEQRDANLRRVIAEALDDLPADGRKAAIELLDRLEGPRLDDGLYFSIILLAEAEGGITPFADAAIRFLVSEEATVVRPRLVDFLATQTGPRAMQLLADSLAGLGAEAALAGLVDDRPFVRRAGVRAIAIRADDDAVARLRGLIDDADMGVRLEALAGLGQLKAKEALPAISRAAADESRPEVRAAALRALGAVGGATVVPELVDALRSDSIAVRVAAIQGLEATGHPDAVTPLLYAMERDPYAGVVAVASRAVVTLGGEKASAGFRRLGADPKGKRSVRVAAVQGLGKLGDREALASLLGDAEVGEEAALALADLRDGRAVPRLLESVTEGRSRRSLPALEGLAARSFGVRSAAEVATLFLGWWEAHKDGNPSSWLISAMRDRGYDVGPLEEGTDARRSLGLLIRALDDESWALRYSAARELEARVGKSFGAIAKYTSREDAQRIADLWRRWWEEAYPR
jgi:HEAT repeat protein